VVSIDLLLEQISEADMAELEVLEAAERSLRFGGRRKVLDAIERRRLELTS
jgi:hypothetical protein